MTEYFYAQMTSALDRKSEGRSPEFDSSEPNQLQYQSCSIHNVLITLIRSLITEEVEADRARPLHVGVCRKYLQMSLCMFNRHCLKLS